MLRRSTRRRAAGSAAGLTLGEAADHYARGLPLAISRAGRAYAATTIATYRETLAGFVARCGRELPLERVSEARVLGYYAEMRAAGRAASYVQTHDKVVRLFLRFCRERNLLARDQLAQVRRLTAADPPIEALSDRDVARVLAACGPGDGRETWEGLRSVALVHVLWRCGLRASEACGLDLADYDSGRAQLTVRGTKSDAARCVVGVPDDAAYAVQDWLVRGRGRGRAGCSPASGAISSASQPSPIWSSGWASTPACCTCTRNASGTPSHWVSSGPAATSTRSAGCWSTARSRCPRGICGRCRRRRPRHGTWR